MSSAALGLLVIAVPLAAQSRLSVPLLVRETNGIARDGAPVYVGVPLPPDAPADPDELAVVDSDDRPVPADLSVLARWHGPADDPNLPIRWLGVALSVEVAASATRQLRLEGVATPRDPLPPLARRDNDGVRIDTGSIAFRLPATGPALIDDVWFDLDGRPGVDTELVPADHVGGLQIPDGSGWQSGWQATNVEIVRNGAVRTMVRIDLAPTSPELGAATLWVEAYARAGWIKLTLVRNATDRVPASPWAMALQIRTLGDPLQLGVRRASSNDLLEGPLPGDATLALRAATGAWSATLGKAHAADVRPTAQISTLTWTAAVALNDHATSEVRMGGDGLIRVDLPGAETGKASRETLFFELRRRSDIDGRLDDFRAPLQVVLPAAWYRDSMALGPVALVGRTPTEVVPTGNWDPLLGATLDHLARGDRSTGQRAHKLALEGLDRRFRNGLAGAALYAWSSGDPELLSRVAAIAALGESGPGMAAGWNALDALAASELTGDARHLERARALLRDAIGAAWTTGACQVAGAEPAELALLMEATGRFVWTMRLQGKTDAAAEDALFAILARVADCPPPHPAWADVWAYGAILTDDPDSRRRWYELGTAALANLAAPPFATDSSLRARAGIAHAWLSTGTDTRRGR